MADERVESAHLLVAQIEREELGCLELRVAHLAAADADESRPVTQLDFVDAGEGRDQREVLRRTAKHLAVTRRQRGSRQLEFVVADVNELVRHLH